jgi:serine-type D-Ala-D-Ala carboxypeptidase (penicillin-binding protein 5/6)
MMALSFLRGRLQALLSFGIALITVLVTTAGFAWADTASTPVLAEPLTSSITISANDLGGFSSTPPAITSPSAIVINQATGEVLFEKNSHAALPMASTTKMMTAIVVLESMDLNAQVTMSENAVSQSELDVWTKAGDVFTVEQLLYSLMVPSHNQAAVALAEAFPGGEPAFVARMNARASELGMTGTHYINPSGLDRPGHQSTTADLAALARFAMNDEKIGATFRKLISTREYALQVPGQSGTLIFNTTNELLAMYDWITGVKTGETPLAKTCLVAAGTKDGASVISAVLGQPDHGLCFTESKDLLDYSLSQYKYVTILEQGAAIAEAVVPYQDTPLQLVAKDKVGMGLSKGQTVTAKVVIDHPVILPVEAGQVFGRVELSVDGQSAGSGDLVASRSVGRPTLGSKIAHFFAGLF